MHKVSAFVALLLVTNLVFGCNSSKDKTRSATTQGPAVAGRENTSDQAATMPVVENVQQTSVEVKSDEPLAEKNPEKVVTLPASKLGWDGTTFIGTATMGLVPME